MDIGIDGTLIYVTIATILWDNLPTKYSCVRTELAVRQIYAPGITKY